VPFILPTVVDPPKLCVKIEIPNDLGHLNAFFGNLVQLAYWFNWDRDDAHTGLAVSKVWYQVYQSVVQAIIDGGGCADGLSALPVEMPEMSDFRVVCIDGVRYAQFLKECCPEEWISIALVNQLNQSPQGGGTQPQPQPGGGTQQYCNTLFANGILYASTNVSSGDVITLGQFSGSGYDGTEVDGNGNPLFRCLDGQVFFNGDCNGGSHIDSGDPVPEAPHMSLVAKIAGSFYYITTLGFTVPSGISNAPVIFQVNDANLSDNQGSYSLCVTFQNNQNSTFTHTFNSIDNPGGMTAFISGAGHPRAAFSLGNGWGPGDPDFMGVIQLNLPVVASRVITEVDVTVTNPLTGATSTVNIQQSPSGTSLLLVSTTLTTFALVFPGGGVAGTGIFVNVENSIVEGDTYDGFITQVVVKGIGTDPY